MELGKVYAIVMGRAHGINLWQCAGVEGNGRDTRYFCIRPSKDSRVHDCGVYIIPRFYDCSYDPFDAALPVPDDVARMFISQLAHPYKEKHDGKA